MVQSETAATKVGLKCNSLVILFMVKFLSHIFASLVLVVFGLKTFRRKAIKLMRALKMYF
jgi:type III secretory pathway component EscU